MHAALPRPGGVEFPSSSAFTVRRNKFVASIKRFISRGSSNFIPIILIFIFLLYIFSGSKYSSNRYSNRAVSNGSQKVFYSKEPYIFPSFSPDVEGVGSTTAVLYKGTKKSSPKIIVVTGFDRNMGGVDFHKEVLANRLTYAQKHGYGVYGRYFQDYKQFIEHHGITRDKIGNWAKFFIIRDAMLAFPDAERIWWLDLNVVITNDNINLEEHVLDPKVLDTIMLRDQALIPPESIIHTYKRVPADQIKFVVTQDDKGLSASSFVVSNDLYGRVLMDYWRDPLQMKYGAYRDQQPSSPENAALTHLVQWHPTILSKVALVPGRYLASRAREGVLVKDNGYVEGDLTYVLPNDCFGLQCVTKWRSILSTYRTE
ncbi:hypothetical protein NADFUDRAFT_49778 [Nadsonia fulvescens var. elongata DSM 6958]|uniref:Galactosyl transferase n=1 Tax=Nadsonia fulvescens var. elongata DSM 6958 TaxID=857566 RepID=A0A1E3PPI1_9ASCO|nr:hypothetical protein NADFUDRAFT_49778 [Nadsonia fulvescens var. elongata DSM 6958]